MITFKIEEENIESLLKAIDMCNLPDKRNLMGLAKELKKFTG